MSLLVLIQANAEAVDRLWRQVHETAAIRHRSSAHREAWRKASEDFHRSYAELAFPGGEQRWLAFLARDSSELGTAISFLKADPRFFRSGYLKQIIWDRLKRASLSVQQERQIEAVAVEYLHRRVQREFWHMSRYLRMRGSPGFWQGTEALASANTGPASVRAQWLMLAKENQPVRMWIGYELRRARYEPGYSPCFEFPPDHGR